MIQDVKNGIKLTLSVFIFLEAAAFLLASSLTCFLFDFTDLAVVTLPEAEGVGFEGVISAGSCFGGSVFFGASTGDISVSSSTCTCTQKMCLDFGTYYFIRISQPENCQTIMFYAGYHACPESLQLC